MRLYQRLGHHIVADAAIRTGNDPIEIAAQYWLALLILCFYSQLNSPILRMLKIIFIQVYIVL